MLARYLYNSYTAGDVRNPSLVAYIPIHLTPARASFSGGLSRNWAGRTGQRTNETLGEDIRTLVLNVFESGRNCIVMIDEAQSLVRRQLDVIRELFNFNARGVVPIQVVLTRQGRAFACPCTTHPT